MSVNFSTIGVQLNVAMRLAALNPSPTGSKKTGQCATGVFSGEEKAVGEPSDADTF